MLAMHPIDEPEVIRYINRERFAGILRGYVMTEDDSYVGYALFKEEAGVITVLDSNIKEPVKLDGIVRACIATGENNGNPFFV